HQLYLGRKKQAWIRFGLLVGVFPLFALLFLIPSIGIVAVILAALIVPILFLWGIVDIFKVYLKRVDADGNPLQAGPRDTRATKIVFIVTIVSNTVLPIILIFTSITSYQQVQQRARESMNRQNEV